MTSHNGGMIAAIVAAVSLQANTLSPAEVRDGWRLLFDGKTTKGWHNFKSKGVGPGWVIEGGTLTSKHVATAGDIVTDEKFDWFELTLDVNLGRGQNSGIMFRVVEEGLAPWHSGPEVQLYDHPPQEGVETTGYLYQLYGSKVDASKPSGFWNHLRIVVAPDKCWTEVNGVKYYEYVYGSPDFWARVAKSKFAVFPGFGKAKRGSIGIQGDHGTVSFKNIKIRPLKASPSRVYN